MGTEECWLYSASVAGGQECRWCRWGCSLADYAKTAQNGRSLDRPRPYYSVVSVFRKTRRCETTENLHRLVRRVCPPKRPILKSPGRLVMSAEVPLPGPAGHRSAERRKVRSSEAARSGTASEAMPSPCAPGRKARARVNWGRRPHWPGEDRNPAGRRQGERLGSVSLIPSPVQGGGISSE